MSAAEAMTATAPRPASRRGVGAILRGRAGRPGLAFRTFRRAVIEALRRRQPEIAGRLVNIWHGCPGYFRFALDADRFGSPDDVTVIRLEFGADRCMIRLHPQLIATRLIFVSCRLIEMLTLLASCRGAPAGTVLLNTDDYAPAPGLAFSDSRPDRWLIPDPVFLAERAYARTALHYRLNDLPWAERRRVAFWRGSTTGGEIGCGSWEELDRVRLCRIAAEHPALFDAGLAGIAQMSPADAAAIKESGLVRDFVPDTRFNEYAYQIDIDGNSNSWPGLFQKLQTGSPVLKVTSRHGYRQWYYDRLVPWENYVPVETDLSDLVDNVQWLIAHDDEARRIGAAGRALAASMTLAQEIENGRATIFAALEQQAAP